MYCQAMTIHNPLSAEALFIDIDGTAVDSEPLIRSIIEKMADNAGYKINPSHWQKFAGLGDKGIWEYIVAEHPDFQDSYPSAHAFEIARMKIYVAQIDNVQPILPVRNLTETFLDAGKPVVAVTTALREIGTRNLIAGGYRIGDIPLFAAEDATDIGKRLKPYPDLYEMAFQATANLTPHLMKSHSLGLEDSPNGALASLRAEIPTIQFNNYSRFLNRDELHSIRNMAEYYKSMPVSEFHRLTR